MTKRAILVMATISLTLLAASGVALAVTRIGTDGPDTLRGTNGADQLVGKGGNDVLLALAPGRGADALQVRAGVGLGQPDARTPHSGREVGQVPPDGCRRPPAPPPRHQSRP